MNGALVVELGGGDSPNFHPNLDIRPLETVDIVADLAEPFPLKSEVFDSVFSKFLLEHLPMAKVRPFISEVYRILKPGGNAIIITANLLEQARLLINTPEEQWNDNLIYLVFTGMPDYPSNYHKSSMSPTYAQQLFTQGGFENVQVFEWLPSKAIWGYATEMVIMAFKPKLEIDRRAWVHSKIQLSDTILEVGCSDNYLYKGTEFQVITLDMRINPNEDGYCVPDVLGIAEFLPFRDKSFDVTSVCDLLEHVPNPQKVLKEALRVARRKVVVTVPSEYDWPPELKPLWNPSHIRFYTLSTFEEEMKATGFPFKAERICCAQWVFLVAELMVSR